MNSRNIKMFFVVMSLIAVILACSLPSSGNPTAVSPADSTTESAPPADIGPKHQITPAGLPETRSSHAGDYDSSTTAAKKTSAGGDRFTFGRFERPFNANTMDVYFPELDIVDTLVLQDDTWIYGTITLKGPDANKALSGKYALELDLNLDGKGDWLVVASSPASTDWTVKGVQVFQDTNKDVGADLALLADKGAPGGDGFETLVFDQGIGKDPDSAWVRISPDDSNTVEIAVKRSVLGNTDKYLINMWAGHSLLDPKLFDINDHFTQDQAGAADISLKIYYPIKAVSEIDNSCRMAVGFQPTGKEPGLCEVLIPNVPGGQTCQSDPATVASCNQSGGQWDAKNCKCNVPK